MKVERFSIYRAYEIVCKAFWPEDLPVRAVMIGVHGFAGDKESSMLKKLAKAAAERGAALVCFDFPAHGASVVGEDKLTVDNCKEDLLAVAAYVTEKYPQAQKYLFATSFGGYISLLCQDRLEDFQYILRAPAITMPRLLTDTVLKIARADFQSRGVVECGFERKLQLPYSFLEDLERQEDLMKKTLQRPVCIFHGDRDDIVPPAVISEFASAHPGTALTILEGADHRFKNPGEMETIIAGTMEILAR